MKKIIALVLGLVMIVFAQDIKSERQVKLEKSLMSPCCYGGAIYDHESQISYDMKDEIASMILDGKSDQDILTHYEKKYGEKILASPKASGFNLAAWYVPIIIVVIALILYLLYSIKLNNRKMAFSSSPHNIKEDKRAKPSDIDAQIDRELDELKQSY